MSNVGIVGLAVCQPPPTSTNQDGGNCIFRASYSNTNTHSITIARSPSHNSYMHGSSHLHLHTTSTPTLLHFHQAHNPSPGTPLLTCVHFAPLHVENLVLSFVAFSWSLLWSCPSTCANVLLNWSRRFFSWERDL